MPLLQTFTKRFAITAGAAAFALTAAYAADLARSEWNIRDHQKPAEVIVQSHRGAGELAPENTIEAFELGWKLGTYPESDIRTTKDGVIVCFHDNNFERVVKGVAPDLAKKGVGDVTWDELQKMDVGSWMGESFKGHHVVKLEDVLKIMQGKPDRHLYMDIKKVDFEQLAKLVNKYGVGAQLILASPKHEQIILWKKLVPESGTLLWVSGMTEAEQAKKFDAAKNKNFEGITQVQIHTHIKDEKSSITRSSDNPFTASDKFLVDSGNTLRQHHILYQTLPYGGAYEGVYWKLLDLGLQSFATDHPKVTRKAIEDYYQQPK